MPSPQAFKAFPCALFHVSWTGRRIRLQVGTPGTRSYDLETAEDGYVRRTKLDLSNYQSPNGARMTPNVPFFRMYLEKVKKNRPGLLIHEIPEGTPLTKGLLLVQDELNRFSIHPRERMKLSMFENKLTNFMHRFGKFYTRDEWLEAYPPPAPKPPRNMRARNTITRSIMRPWRNNELAETVGQLSMCPPPSTDSEESS